MFAPLLDVEASVCAAGASDFTPCWKRGKRVGFVAFSKTLAGVGHLKRICKDAFRVVCAIQETHVSDMLGGFPSISEHQIFKFAKIILRDRCSSSTSYDLASLFRGRRSTLDRWTGKIAKRIGMRPSALQSTFRSRRISSFLTLFAESLHFWCCQVQKKLRKSRRIASFSSLQIDRYR